MVSGTVCKLGTSFLFKSNNIILSLSTPSPYLFALVVPKNEENLGPFLRAFAPFVVGYPLLRFTMINTIYFYY